MLGSDVRNALSSAGGGRPQPTLPPDQKDTVPDLASPDMNSLSNPVCKLAQTRIWQANYFMAYKSQARRAFE